MGEKQVKYTIQESKTYAQAADAVFAAAVGAVDGLQGKVKQQDGGAGTLEATFDKKIHGKVLGDRTEFKVVVSAGEGGETAVVVEAYPIDAVGRPLLFGARKGVTRTVLDWYWAHVAHRLNGG